MYVNKYDVNLLQITKNVEYFFMCLKIGFRGWGWGCRKFSNVWF